MLPSQKHLFSIPDDVHYLNGAYMSPLSKAVEEAGLEGMRAKRSPGEIEPADFFETSDRVRTLFGGLIGAPANSIAIIPAASYGIATAARNLPVETGQRIVIADEQFPSNVYVWKRIAEEKRAEIYTVEPPRTALERGKTWNERILEAIDVKTAIVAAANIHWADGTWFDLEKIGSRAHDVGAALVLDGTQSIGALPFDVDRIQPDALICAGYKWLMGPYGLGVAYYGPRFSDGIPLEENWITRKDSERFGALVEYTNEYQPGAIRYDVGERSNFILTPMLEAALKHLTEWQTPRIQAYCNSLIEEFVALVRKEGFWIEDADWRAGHLFGVRVRDDISMERLMSALRAAKISVSIRGTAVRISPNVYNDSKDIEAISTVFEDLVRNQAISSNS